MGGGGGERGRRRQERRKGAGRRQKGMCRWKLDMAVTRSDHSGGAAAPCLLINTVSGAIERRARRGRGKPAVQRGH